VVPRRDRSKTLLIGVTRGLALLVVAGGVGAALGIVLSNLSSDDQPAPSFGSAGTTASGADTGATRTQTTTAPSRPGSEQVGVRVLGAVLRSAGEPSGVTPQDGELVMRVRIENRGSRSVTIEPPVLRIGSVRTPLDPETLTLATIFGRLSAGATKAVTLRFQLTGEATPKATRDRRARIEVAGQSVALRIKVDRS